MENVMQNEEYQVNPGLIEYVKACVDNDIDIEWIILLLLIGISFVHELYIVEDEKFIEIIQNITELGINSDESNNN